MLCAEKTTNTHHVALDHMLSNRFALSVGKSQKFFSMLSEVNKITEKNKCPIMNTERHKKLFPYFYIFLLNNIIN